MPLTAPLDQTKPPPFWEMEEYRFQEFCQAVWRSENADCHIYGVRGQKQHGIDLRTYGQPSGAGSVGQCKCYKEFTSADMRRAVKEFTAHLAFWRLQKIKVYRLYVASSCANTAVQKEYTKQKQLLSRKGITFQLDDSHGLVTCLRNEPTIVSRFTLEACQFRLGPRRVFIDRSSKSHLINRLSTSLDNRYIKRGYKDESSPCQWHCLKSVSAMSASPKWDPIGAPNFLNSKRKEAC